MDCCNYVQPYAMAGHHYYQQQAMAAAAAQQHLHLQPQQAAYCYEAPTNAYAPYGAGGGSSAAAIEAASARYNNCRLPPAYPTDYVYNPKEARLRKAMREQSRELSRSAAQQHQQQQQQQQSSNGPSILGSNGSSRLSSQQQQQAVSPLPGGNSSSSIAAGGGGGGGGANRIIGPWFPLAGAPPPATHPKPILSPRVMVAHQRTLDKTKEAMRKQLECSGQGGFPGSNGVSAYHHGDYRGSGSQESGPDYCGPGAVSDFAEGQKWHPYQNGVNAYHSRSALMSKMSSLHRGMQSAAPHPTSAWGQFCNVPFATSQSAMMRSSRHMVFLQEQQNQQSQQHCGYPDDMHMSYEAKMQDNLACRLHSSYSQEEQHVKSPLTSIHLAQLAHEEPKLNNVNGCNSSQLSCPEDGPRWGTPRPSSVSSSSCTTDTILERESDSQPPATAKSENTKPLPGFQEAFGSTEMGRFSRSELFASLVEAANFIPSEGILKSCTVFPYSTSVESLSQLKNEDLRKRLKAEDCYWIEPLEVLNLKPQVSSTSTKPEDYSRTAQEWPTSAANNTRLPPALCHHRDCECMSFTLPTDDKQQQDECLDLRLPSRKKPKEDLDQEYPDSSSHVEEKE